MAGKDGIVPIHKFRYAFDMWKNAGWTHVASEGGRKGDLDCLKNYFTKFTFYNCDRMRNMGNFHVEPFTTEVSWETYYHEEIPYIQQGAVSHITLGKGQGILAGVWEQNNKCCRFETYKGLLDWSYGANVGFTHFCVWFDVGPTLNDYKRLGFETIVSQLQRFYPADISSGFNFRYICEKRWTCTLCTKVLDVGNNVHRFRVWCGCTSCRAICPNGYPAGVRISRNAESLLCV